MHKIRSHTSPTAGQMPVLLQKSEQTERVLGFTHFCMFCKHIVKIRDRPYSVFNTMWPVALNERKMQFRCI